MQVIITWVVSAIVILAISYILPGVAISGLFAALLAVAVMALVNAFVKPMLVALTLPINVATLGAFLFVINALMVMLVAAFVPGFTVDNFWWALLFSIILSAVVVLLRKVDVPAMSTR